MADAGGHVQHIADVEVHRAGAADIAGCIHGLDAQDVAAVAEAAGGDLQAVRRAAGAALELTVDPEVDARDADVVAGFGLQGQRAVAGADAGADHRRRAVYHLVDPDRRRPEDLAVVLGDFGVIEVLADRRREVVDRAAGQLGDGAVALRHAFIDLDRGGALAGARCVVGDQVQRAGVGEGLAHQAAVGRQHQLRRLVHGGEDAAGLDGLHEGVHGQRRAIGDQDAVAVDRRGTPVGAVVVLVGGEGDLEAGLQGLFACAFVAAVAVVAFVGGVGEGGCVHHLAQGHGLLAVRRVAEGDTVDQVLARAGRVVELADQATLSHQGVELGGVGLLGEDIGQQLAVGVVLPAQQIGRVEDVHVAAATDGAPFHAVDAKELGVGGIEVARRGQAGLVQVLGIGRGLAGVGAGGAVEHMVVFGGQ